MPGLFVWASNFFRYQLNGSWNFVKYVARVWNILVIFLPTPVNNWFLKSVNFAWLFCVLLVCTCTIWIGHLPKNIQNKDVEVVLEQFGPIESIDVSPANALSILIFQYTAGCKKFVYLKYMNCTYMYILWPILCFDTVVKTGMFSRDLCLSWRVSTLYLLHYEHRGKTITGHCLSRCSCVWGLQTFCKLLCACHYVCPCVCYWCWECREN